MELEELLKKENLERVDIEDWFSYIPDIIEDRIKKGKKDFFTQRELVEIYLLIKDGWFGEDTWFYSCDTIEYSTYDEKTLVDIILQSKSTYYKIEGKIVYDNISCWDDCEFSTPYEVAPHKKIIEVTEWERV